MSFRFRAPNSITEIQKEMGRIVNFMNELVLSVTGLDDTLKEASPPIDDDVSVVGDHDDASRQMRIDVGAVEHDVTRVLTMPNEDIDLTPDATFAHESHMDFFNGTIVEKFSTFVTSDGTTVVMKLEKTGGGDLTLKFSSGESVFDTTPAIEVELVVGTNAIPKENFVYVLESTRALTVSTSWPTTEHIKIAYTLVPSASRVNGVVNNDFLYVNQSWNDFEKAPNGEGHLSHITEHARRLGALYFSGCEGIATQDGNDLWVSVAAGTVYQLHEHRVDALDSDTAGAGVSICVINDPDSAYASINSLNEITKLSDGSAIGNNKYVAFVVWVAANEEDSPSPLMLNLPEGEYNSAADASKDVNGVSNFSIPREYRLESSVGFLVATFVCKHTTSAMEIQITNDLRGEDPTHVGGGGTGGGDVTSAAAITDNAVVRGDGGAKGVQHASGVTIDDSNNMAISGTVDGRDVATDGTKLDGIETSADVTDEANVNVVGKYLTPISPLWVRINDTSGQLTYGDVDIATGVVFWPGVFLEDTPSAGRQLLIAFPLPELYSSSNFSFRTYAVADANSTKTVIYQVEWKEFSDNDDLATVTFNDEGNTTANFTTAKELVITRTFFDVATPGAALLMIVKVTFTSSGTQDKNTVWNFVLTQET